MPDPTGSAADQFDDHLNADGQWRASDELAGFVGRVLRQAALPDNIPATLSEEQRDRIRQKVFGDTPNPSQARTPMHAATTVPTLPTAQPQRTYQSKPSALSILMTAALVAIIGIAGVGLLRGSLDFLPDRNGSGPAGAPGVVYQPDATPLPSSECDLTGDIPVVTGLDVIPWDRTLLVHDDDTLTLHCDRASTEIASGVTGIRGTFWPGAFIATMDDGTLRAMNIITGANTDLGPETMLTEADESDYEPLFFRVRSPWMFIPANPELTDWRIVDLRSMESLLLPDDSDVTLPHRPIPFWLASADDTLVVDFDSGPWPITGVNLVPTPDPSATGTPVLVIDGSLDNRRWTEIAPRSDVTASLSPDGALLAVTRETDDSLTVDVERTRDGELVAETGIDLGRPDNFLVLDDDAGLLHLSRLQLDLVTWDGEVATTTLVEFDADDGQPNLRRTADPDVVIVHFTATLGEPRDLRVNVTSGEVTELPGLVTIALYPDYTGGAPPQHVIGTVPDSDDARRGTVQLIDVSTGEVVIESDAIDLYPDSLRHGASFLTADSQIAFVHVGMDRMLVLDATAGTTFVMEAPDDDRVYEWFIVPSADGALLSAFTSALDLYDGVPSSLAEVGRDPEWIEVSPGGFPALVVGTHALPTSENDEPTAMEAQEVTLLEASPAATPAP